MISPQKKRKFAMTLTGASPDVSLKDTALRGGGDYGIRPKGRGMKPAVSIQNGPRKIVRAVFVVPAFIKGACHRRGARV